MIFLRKLALITLTLFDILAKASTIQQPFFYRVEKDGKSSYLLGAFDLGVSLEDLPKSVIEKIHRSNVFIVERVKPSSEVDAFFNDPVSGFLKTVGAEPKVDAMVAQRLLNYGVPESVARNLPDKNCAIVIYAHYFFPRPASMGVEVLKLGYELKKTMVQLDSDQLLNDAKAASAESNPCSVTRDILQYSPEEIRVLANKPIDSYKSGQEPESTGDDDPGVRLRNQAWIKKLNPELDKGNAFISVGVSHLFGASGLINLLREQGYSITRMNGGQ